MYYVPPPQSPSSHPFHRTFRSISLTIATLLIVTSLISSSAMGQETIVLTASSPNAVVEQGKDVVIFGTSAPNSITIKKGASVKILNNPGTNTITIEADSTEFKVLRSGAMVTLEAEDSSDPLNPLKTVIKLPATKTNQTIKFNNGSLNLSIASGKVMLGEQEITLTSASIIKERIDCILPTKTFEEIAFDSSEDDTGNIRFLKAEDGYAIAQPIPLSPSATVEEAARSFLSVYGSVFGVQTQSSDLSIMKTTAAGNGRTFARFQQKHDQIPVLGAELIVQMDAGKNIMSVNGEILGNADTSKLSIRKINKNRKKVMRKITARTTPGITAYEASVIALSTFQSTNDTDALLTTTTPELIIYNPILLGFSSPDKDMLVWSTEVNSSDSAIFSELFLVDANLGEVVLHFNQIDSAKEINTFNAQKSETLPLVECPQISAVPDSDCDNATDFASDTYNFYYKYHGRDSIDNKGMKIISNVNYPVHVFWKGNNPCNACWAGYLNQIFYGFGCTGGSIVADDVVAHEITHGVTQYTSRLIYLNQSGAINESFSDIWGEFIDLTNGKGNDRTDVRWIHGEDYINGGSRNLADPTIHGDPDTMSSSFYYSGTGDKGGVHTNSGVGNKAAFLITDGGTFNGYTIKGLGIEKTAGLFYEVQTNLLTRAANYADLSNALILACSNLKYGAEDCQQVGHALEAVEIVKNRLNIIGIRKKGTQNYNNYAEMYVFKSNNIRKIATHVEIPYGTINEWQFEVADWNNDGQQDIVGICTKGGQNNTIEVHVLNGKNMKEFLTHAEIPYGTINEWQFEVADWNSDGQPDIVGICTKGGQNNTIEVHVLNGKNMKEFLTHAEIAYSIIDEYQYEVADWNNDGQPDIVGICTKGGQSNTTEVHVLNGKNMKEFLAHAEIAYSIIDEYQFKVADWNCDGQQDIVGFCTKGGHSHTTEVHVLNGKNMKEFLTNVDYTPIPEAGDGWDWDFAVADWY